MQSKPGIRSVDSNKVVERSSLGEKLVGKKNIQWAEKNWSAQPSVTRFWVGFGLLTHSWSTSSQLGNVHWGRAHLVRWSMGDGV